MSSSIESFKNVNSNMFILLLSFWAVTLNGAVSKWDLQCYSKAPDKDVERWFKRPGKK